MSDAHDRLSQIPTLWSVVREAHRDHSAELQAAQEQILGRYGHAIERYLLAAVRDADVAAEIYQDFSLKFLSGGLGSADPARGRFRSFLKTILFRMVADYHRGRRRQPNAGSAELAEPAVEPDSGQQTDFAQTWREALLTKTWERLQSLEAETGKPHYTVLRLRADRPDADSTDLAYQLSDQLDRTLDAGHVRVLLHRAREKFGDLLLDEVIHSLDSDHRDQVEEELIELRLLEYCRPALVRRQRVEGAE